MKVLKATVIALTALSTYYGLKAAEVPGLRSEVADLKIRLDHMARESAALFLRALHAERRADTMTAAALTAPTAPSIAPDFAARLRAERDEESNTYGVEL